MAEEQHKRIFLIDIDGTICEPVCNEEDAKRMLDARPFEESIQRINELFDHGHYICFFTARTDEHREVTERWLGLHGVKYHKVIFNKPRKTEHFREYHFVDDSPVRATTFKGRFTGFVRKNKEIEVFDDRADPRSEAD